MFFLNVHKSFSHFVKLRRDRRANVRQWQWHENKNGHNRNMTNTHQNTHHRSFVPPQTHHFQVGFSDSLLTNHASIDVNQMYMLFFVNNEVDAIWERTHFREKKFSVSRSFIYFICCALPRSKINRIYGWTWPFWGMKPAPFLWTIIINVSGSKTFSALALFVKNT